MTLTSDKEGITDNCKVMTIAVANFILIRLLPLFNIAIDCKTGLIVLI